MTQTVNVTFQSNFETKTVSYPDKDLVIVNGRLYVCPIRKDHGVSRDKHGAINLLDWIHAFNEGVWEQAWVTFEEETNGETK